MGASEVGLGNEAGEGGAVIVQPRICRLSVCLIAGVTDGLGLVLGFGATGGAGVGFAQRSLRIMDIFKWMGVSGA